MELKELIEKVKQNDQSAFEELYNLYYPMGFSLALQFVKAEDEALDIMQDAFITVCSKIDTLEDSNKFKSWYMQIVANKCRDFLKKKNPLSFTDANMYDEDGALQFEVEDDDRDFKPEEAVDYSETVRIVDEMLAELPEEQKMCLLLYYANDMKISEIAESLDVSEATVKSRLKYGKEKIREKTEEYQKKTGTKLYGITGVSLIPFIRWMFNNKNSSLQIPNSNFELIKETIGSLNFSKGNGQVNNIGLLLKDGFNMETKNTISETTFSDPIKKTCKKVIGKIMALPTYQKIISAIAAGAILIGSIAGVSNISSSNDNNGGAFSGTSSGNIFSSKTQINFKNYITMDYKGSNGYATASYKVNSSALENLVEKSKIDAYIIKNMGEEGRLEVALGDYYSIDSILEFNISNNSSLSNGDTVIVNIDVAGYLKRGGADINSLMDYFNIKFDTTLYFNVIGLSQYEEIDIYNMIKDYIKYSRGDGNAYAFLEFPENHMEVLADKIYMKFSGNNDISSRIGSISFVVDNESIGSIDLLVEENGILSNGKKFVIKLNSYSQGEINKELQKYGYSIEKNKFEHTASGIGYYINSFEQFNDSVVNSFVERFKNSLDKKTQDSSVTTYALDSIYALELKPSEVKSGSSICEIRCIFKATSKSSWTGESVNFYSSKCINLLINSDGTVDYTNNGLNDGPYKTSGAAVEKFDTSKFDVKKIY